MFFQVAVSGLLLAFTFAVNILFLNILEHFIEFKNAPKTKVIKLSNVMCQRPCYVSKRVDAESVS